MSAAAVFLDRDGVLTASVVSSSGERPPWSLDELVIVPGAQCAMARLRAAGFVLVVVTNQPDVARGQVDAGEVARINDAVAGALGVDAIYVCPHDGSDGCECRKPLPGMLLQAAALMGIDIGCSWMVGDRWVDIAAGSYAGARTVLIERLGSWEATSAGAPPPDLRPDIVVSTVAAAASAILAA